jgi:hypothetical protein
VDEPGAGVDYGKALDAVADDPAAHPVVISA